MMRLEKGYTLLEALLAIALAALFFSGATGLVLTSNRTSAEAVMRQKALWRAQEGLSALEASADANLVNTTVGSLTFASNRWTLGTSAPQDLGGGITRTVKVSAVQRNSTCDLVASGGTVDTSSHTFESNVTWTDLRGQTQTISLKTLRTNFENPTSSCFADECSRLAWDYSATTWYGGKQLRDMFVTNLSEQEVEIIKITPTWNGTPKIQQIFIGNDKFWTSIGPGTPSGVQSSGVTLTGQDARISGGVTVEIPKIQFDGIMTGATLTVLFECEDHSTVTIGPFVPT